MTYLAIGQAGIIIIILILSVRQVFKVTNGFQELLSIFIQMDNTDIKQISKFTQQVTNIFGHLGLK
jgi:hypothetical protein